MGIKTNKLYHIIFAITSLIFVSLDSKYTIPGDMILRWALPILFLVVVLFKEGTVKFPKMTFYIPVVIVFFGTTLISPHMMYSVSRAISFVLITMMVYNYYYFLKNSKELLTGIKILALFLLIYEVLNFIFLEGSGDGRARGMTGNPNSLGIFSNVAFIFAFLYFINCKAKFPKIVLLAIVVMSVVTAIASGSRTYTVGILLNIIFFVQITLTRKYRAIFWVLFVLIFLLGFTFFSNLLIQLPGIDRLINAGTDRGLIWVAGMKLVRKKPIFGWGYGVSQKLNNPSYLGYIRDYGDYNLAFHNSYLTILIETGIVGLLFIIILVLSIVIKVIKYIRIYKDKNAMVILMLIFTMLLCFYGCSAMNSVGSTEGFVFWSVLIWAEVYIKRIKAEKKIISLKKYIKR